MPESWDPASPKAAADVDERRGKAGIGDDIGHREKWRLALDMIDELIGWGRRPPLIVADSGYGDAAEFRRGLAERGLAYVVQVTAGNPQRLPRRHRAHHAGLPRRREVSRAWLPGSGTAVVGGRFDNQYRAVGRRRPGRPFRGRRQ